MPQSLKYFSMHLYALDDRVSTRITCKLTRSVKIIQGIVAYTVGVQKAPHRQNILGNCKNTGV